MIGGRDADGGTGAGTGAGESASFPSTGAGESVSSPGSASRASPAPHAASASVDSSPSPAELEVLGDRVYCDDELRLAWTEIEALPEEAALLRTNARNETVLRALAMLEEHDASQSDDAERAELHRLEGKLDLALELLADLVRGRNDSLAPRRVRFNARGLCWDCEDPPPVGALLAIDCYVLPPWPLPLELHGRVTGVDRHAERAYRACARLEGQTGGVNDWLGKLVFRRHRRSIAQQRHRGSRME